MDHAYDCPGAGRHVHGLVLHVLLGEDGTAVVTVTDHGQWKEPWAPTRTADGAWPWPDSSSTGSSSNAPRRERSRPSAGDCCGPPRSHTLSGTASLTRAADASAYPDSLASKERDAGARCGLSPSTAVVRVSARTAVMSRSGYSSAVSRRSRSGCAVRPVTVVRRQGRVEGSRSRCRPATSMNSVSDRSQMTSVTSGGRSAAAARSAGSVSYSIGP
ncbi:hypothetical protein [Streptomyces sp. NPDC127038]|uniref:hypothetical protein n=1 Tax=Streptomyces sp. NPDC127038 TaxID=3347114 RepID=UPI00365B0A64